jgi:hypothetical protein
VLLVAEAEFFQNVFNGSKILYHFLFDFSFLIIFSFDCVVVGFVFDFFLADISHRFVRHR